MKFLSQTAITFLTVIASIVLNINPALAHRFNVALVVPLSGVAAAEGGQIRDGFMLATTERDSHPDEESDGHLGGLDVYVTVIDGQKTADFDQLDQLIKLGGIDIVAIPGSAKMQFHTGSLANRNDVVVLLAGQSPFAKSDMRGVVAFTSRFEKAYGRKPSRRAAEGYNAARRIDVAVRSQGGTGDKGALRRIFKQTETGFRW